MSCKEHFVWNQSCEIHSCLLLINVISISMLIYALGPWLSHSTRQDCLVD